MFVFQHNTPHFQETEEREDTILDCNYSKLDIDTLVVDLDINNSFFLFKNHICKGFVH